MKDNSLTLDLVGPEPNDRELAWLYRRLSAARHYNQLAAAPITKDEYFSAVIELINRKHFVSLEERNTFVREVRRQCKASLLANSDIKWISKRNKRLCSWLWVHLLVHYDLKPTSGYLSEDGRYTDSIRHLDLMAGTTYEKLLVLKDLRDKWESISDAKNVDLKWLKEKDEMQTQWAIDYLEKKEIRLSCQQEMHFSSLYDKVLAYIDSWPFSLGQRNEFSYKMKQAWRQKQGRETARGQSEKVKIRLSQKYLLKLEELSELYNHDSPSDTIKHLIDKEHRKMTDSWLKNNMG